MKTVPTRPSGTNADEWEVWLREHEGSYYGFIAVQIAEAIEAERERCAMLHEQVNPASDDERINGVPGAGAMGAVIQYRDLIRKQR